MKIRLWLAAAVVLTGCTRTVYVPSENHSEHTAEDFARIYTADTVVVAERCSVYVRGDTVRLLKERTVWRDRLRRDTVRVFVSDTVTTVRVPPSGSLRNGAASGWIWLLAGVAATLAGVLLLRGRR